MSSTADTNELEALFDSIASGFPQTAAPLAEAPSRADECGAAPGGNGDDGGAVYGHVGRLVRQLHDALKELGYDKMLEGTLDSIPDAKERLAYISNLTEQAASRVLNATDVAGPLQAAMDADVRSLGGDWRRLMSGQMDVAEFKTLAAQTHSFFTESAPDRIVQTQAQLMEIMMAQDFQDLTGQVIRKVVSLAQELEKGLLNVLLEVIPEGVKKESGNSLLNGPVIDYTGRNDVVADQQQVDDLLDSLGF